MPITLRKPDIIEDNPQNAEAPAKRLQLFVRNQLRVAHDVILVAWIPAPPNSSLGPDSCWGAWLKTPLVDTDVTVTIEIDPPDNR